MSSRVLLRVLGPAQPLVRLLVYPAGLQQMDDAALGIGDPRWVLWLRLVPPVTENFRILSLRSMNAAVSVRFADT